MCVCTATPHRSMQHAVTETNWWQVTWESRLPATSPPPFPCQTRKNSSEGRLKQRTSDCQILQARGDNTETPREQDENRLVVVVLLLCVVVVVVVCRCCCCVLLWLLWVVVLWVVVLWVVVLWVVVLWVVVGGCCCVVVVVLL